MRTDEGKRRRPKERGGAHRGDGEKLGTAAALLDSGDELTTGEDAGEGENRGEMERGFGRSEWRRRWVRGRLDGD